MQCGDIILEPSGIYRLVVQKDDRGGLGAVRLSPSRVRGKPEMGTGTQSKLYPIAILDTPYTIVGNIADIDWEHLP